MTFSNSSEVSGSQSDSGSAPEPGEKRRFPFTQVVGQDDAKLALMLVAIDPLIGGVLLRGEKGSAKTTLARGLASLVVEDAPFVELPLGTTEDRLIGTLDIAKALQDRQVAFTPGILSDVDGGILYVDEVNLLADHLVDTLLDVSVSGVNNIERDGIAHSHPARFVLVGSMNPEEGELRPQLLDRFGLSVEVKASTNLSERTEAVRRRLRFDSQDQIDPTTDAEEARLVQQLSKARPAEVPDVLITLASKLALAVGAEGLRADIALCRAAAAFAGLEGRATATENDLIRIAPLVLSHRSRRGPFDSPMLHQDEVSAAVDDAMSEGDQEPKPPGTESSSTEPPSTESQSDAPAVEGSSAPGPSSREAVANDGAMASGAERNTAMINNADALVAKLGQTMAARNQAGRGQSAKNPAIESSRGRLVRDIAPNPDISRPIAVAATVRQIARQSPDPTGADQTASDQLDTGALGPSPTDFLRHAVKETKAGSLLVLTVDTSGSMGAKERAELTTGTAFGLLTDAYQRRDHVAVVTFSGYGTETVLQPTGSIEVARNRLTDLPTGGTTPLAEGIRHTLDLVKKRRDSARVPFCVLLTDARASGSPEAFKEALDEAEKFSTAGYRGLVLDCETDHPRLGLASQLAEAMGVACIHASNLDSAAVTSTIRAAIDQEIKSVR